jgi:hypothetical protein
MNNTKNLLLVAAITSLLIIGTSIIPMQSHAGGSDQQKHKIVSDLKHGILKDMQSENASLHLVDDDS